MHWMIRIIAAIEHIQLVQPFLAVGHRLNIFRSRLVGDHWVRAFHQKLAVTAMLVGLSSAPVILINSVTNRTADVYVSTV